MSSTKGSNVESLLFHTVVYVYVYVLAGTGQGNIRTGYLLRLPLYLQAFHAVTASRCLFPLLLRHDVFFGNLLVFNFKIIKISICKKIDKLILHKKVKILFYYLLFVLTKTYIYIYIYIYFFFN